MYYAELRVAPRSQTGTIELVSVILDARILQNSTQVTLARCNSRSLTRHYVTLKYPRICAVELIITYGLSTRVPYIRDKFTTLTRFASVLLYLLRIKNVI